MSPTSSILLKNGTLLIHSADGMVKPSICDLLIRSNVIERIAKDISAEPGTVVIDCTDKIVSPGFIDTHRHMWHTQMKGYANSMLLEYITEVTFIAGPLYKAEDVFWGQLAGCLEALDAGTTTVVDHSHINHNKENAPSAVNATLTSGIRSFYCYHPMTWLPENPLNSYLAPWFEEQLKDLASLLAAASNSRVIPGLAFDSIGGAKEVVESVIGLARQLGLKLITTHHLGQAPFAASIKVLSDYNLLSNDILFSHTNNITDEEISLLLSKGGFISSTPSTELQMGLGSPACSKPELRGVSSLGVDCHSTTAADLFGQMRLLVQSARNTYTEKLGRVPRETNITVQEVYNMGTIGGARAVGMEASLGSLEEGKLADIVIFDAVSPAMLCGSPGDPVGAIVLHAGTRDVHTVIVDGTIRKSAGVLLPSHYETCEGVEGGEKVEWKTVVKKVIESRSKIEERIKEFDLNKAKLSVGAALGF